MQPLTSDKLIKYLTTLTVFLTVQDSALAADIRTITISTGEWVPLHSENYENGGIASHIIFEAFREEGIYAEFKFLPWERSFQLAKLGKPFEGTAIWGKRKKRMADFLYTDIVITLNNVFFHNPNLTFDWQSLDEIKNYRLVSVIGYEPWEGFGDAVKNNQINVTYVANDIAGLKMVSSQRADLFPNTLEVGREIINSEDDLLSGKNITYHPKPFSTGDYYLLISKKSKNAEELVTIFNSGLKKIKSSGLYDKILLRNSF